MNGLGDEIQTMLRRGMTPFQIRQRVPATSGQISYYRRALGIRKFKGGPPVGVNPNTTAMKEKVRALKLEGLSYAEIGKQLGFSRQRAQACLATYIPKANGRACENCGETDRVHRHHRTYRTDQVQYLCVSCHMAAHVWGENRKLALA